MTYHLIGCIHDDPDGEVRVNRALNRLQPDLITLEWKGHDANPLRRTREFQAALARYHELARAAVEACGYDPDAYDESNRLATAWGPEVRGTLAWVEKRSVTVCPTEEPTQGDEYDRRLIEDPEREAAVFVEWIRGMKTRGEEYHPVAFFPQDFDTGYDLLEAHLAGRLAEVVDADVDCYRRKGVLNQWRHDFGIDAVRSALTSRHSTMVHVGGAWHIADAGVLQPPTLFQALRREFPKLDIVRHSLRQF